jgi:hypothetical protein
MVHIGSVKWEYMGEEKITDKVRLSFEIPSEMRKFNTGMGSRPKMMPMSISKEYTLTMYEKGNLRKDLESWRGKGFTDTEANSFDITKLLGVECMISVVHKTSKQGKEYSLISTISPLMKGTKAPEQINPTFQFNYNDNFNTEWLDNECPSWLAENIKSTEEYKIASTTDLLDDVIPVEEEDNTKMPF